MFQSTFGRHLGVCASNISEMYLKVVCPFIFFCSNKFFAYQLLYTYIRWNYWFWCPKTNSPSSILLHDDFMETEKNNIIFENKEFHFEPTFLLKTLNSQIGRIFCERHLKIYLFYVCRNSGKWEERVHFERRDFVWNEYKMLHSKTSRPS